MAKNNRIDTIYQQIRSKILADEYRPGQKLSETQLSVEHNCSRTPIREILQRLENDGLIIIKPKSGTYVKNETQKDFVDLMQVRAALESLAFSLSIENLKDRDMAKLEKLKADMDSLIEKEPIDMMKFAQIHYQFHLKIVQMSGNALLTQMFERLNLRSSHMFYHMMEKKLAIITQNEHQTIVNHIKSRNREAIDFIRDHLIRKMQRVISGGF